jgi:hypothetical protein
VFLLTKSPRYFFDSEAVKRQGEMKPRNRFTDGKGPKAEGYAAHRQPTGMTECAGRNMRNSDLFYDSLQPEPEAVPKPRRGMSFRTGRAYGGASSNGDVEGGSVRATESPEPLGLICSDAGEPLALDVNPAAFSAAHFATFSPKLVEPLIRAGTSERGCCAACGAPWRRVVEKVGGHGSYHDHTDDAGRGVTQARNGKPAGSVAREGYYAKLELGGDRTTGWAASCTCDAAVVPCTVLDPFAGAGTTLLVADRLQRDAIGIELSDAYGAMAGARCVDDAPLLAWGAVAEAAE